MTEEQVVCPKEQSPEPRPGPKQIIVAKQTMLFIVLRFRARIDRTPYNSMGYHSRPGLNESRALPKIDYSAPPPLKKELWAIEFRRRDFSSAPASAC
jgi:hypothetical protein